MTHLFKKLEKHLNYSAFNIFSGNCVHDKHGNHFFRLIWLRLNYFKKWFSWTQLLGKIIYRGYIKKHNPLVVFFY